MSLKSSRNESPVLPRGRVAGWTRERLDKLSTDELRALRANAEGLKEPEVAALCDDILSGRRTRTRAKKPA